MILTANTQTNTGKGEPIWNGAEILTAGQTGDPVFVPDQAGKINAWLVGLYITSGSGKVQYSLSPRADIEAGNGKWRDWDNGSVTSSADDVFEPVNAVRAICTLGTIIFEVVAV